MTDYLSRDKKVIWHPYTQMLNAPDPIAITGAKGSILYDEKGNQYIDAISSWWTNLHGHCHPYIAEQISKQVTELDHVLFAGFTHPSAVVLAERITKLLPGKQTRAFYSDNGSTAVEVALKMSLQYWKNQSKVKNRILAFSGAYHGDTFGAMSVSERGSFTKAFSDQLFEVDFIPVPVSGMETECITQLEKVLSRAEEYCAFIYEPLVQGSAGMVMYDADSLNLILSKCKAAGMLCIADEVMTGFGRTGTLFASECCNVNPDIYCLSKGISGGFLPLGMTTCTEEIFNAFLSTDPALTFYHGHSYTANPIACRAGLASLDLLEKNECTEQRNFIHQQHLKFADSLNHHSLVKNLRITGTIMAIELETGEETSYTNSRRNLIYHHFIEKGVLLRPLGNIVYLLPPYCITENELKKVYSSIQNLLVKEELSIVK